MIPCETRKKILIWAFFSFAFVAASFFVWFELSHSNERTFVITKVRTVKVMDIVAGLPVKMVSLVDASDITAKKHFVNIPKNAFGVTVRRLGPQELSELNQKKYVAISPQEKLVFIQKAPVVGKENKKNYLAFFLADAQVAVENAVSAVVSGDDSQLVDVSGSEDLTIATSPSDASVVSEPAPQEVVAQDLVDTTSPGDASISPNPVEQQVAVEYSLLAPVIQKTDTDNGQLVTVSAKDETVPLTDVLAYTSIPKIFKVGEESKIKIKWKNNGDQDVTFHAEDTDGDGYLDYVEWTVPHLSEQTFEIIFISKAFQLDANQNIIGDIYDLVKEKDNTWAVITDGQYVRYTFGKVLDNTRDNTIYARPLDPSQPARAEIYPVYEDANGNFTEGPMVATFDNIDHEGEYRALLTNLATPTDVFDIKITGGVEIDWIVDPVYYWVGAAGGNTSVGTNWATSANACGTNGGNSTAPTASDDVHFGSACTNNATVDSALSVTNFYLDTGYTGTVTVSSGQSITTSAALTVSAGTLAIGANNLTVGTTSTVTGGTLTIGASSGTGWTSAGITIGTGGTVTCSGASKITDSANWDSSAGTFTYSGSTLTMTAASANATLVTPSSGNYWDTKFYNLTINSGSNKVTFSSGTSATFSGALNITGEFEVASGRKIFSPAAATAVLNASSKISGAGTFDKAIGNGAAVFTNNGTISVTNFVYEVYAGATTAQVVATTYGGNLSIYNASAGSETCVLGLGTLTVPGNLIVYNSSATYTTTLDVSSNNNTINVGGNIDFKNGSSAGNGAFTPGTSTVTLTGTGAGGTIKSNGQSFYNLTQNGSGGTYTLQDALVVANNLNLTAGTLDTKSGSNWPVTIGNVTTNGSFTQASAGTFTARSSTITINGNGSFTADGNSNSTQSKQYNGASLVLNGTNALRYNNLSSSWSNGFNNLTVGQSGNTTTSPTGYAVVSVLTIGSGTLTGGGYIYLVGSNPLSFNVNSNLTISTLYFFLGTHSIPTLANGYGCSIDAMGTVTQTGDIALSAGKTLGIYASGNVGDAATWKTDGYNLTVGGPVKIGTGLDTALKKLDATHNGTRTSTITVGGAWTNYGTGTVPSQFVADNSTVIFNGTGSAGITSGGSSFYNLTQNGTGGTYTLRDALATTNNLTISAGTLDVSATGCSGASCGITVGGSWDSSTGTFTYRTGTVTLTGTGAGGTIKSNGQSFYNLTQNGSGGTYTLQDALIASNNLTISAGTLAVGNNNLTSSTAFSNSGLVTVGTGTVTIPNTTAGNFTFTDTTTSPTATYTTLTVNGTGKTVTTGGATTATNLTITAGTLAAGNNSLTVSTALSNSGLVTVGTGALTIPNAASGNFTFTDANTIPTATYGTLTVNASGKTLTLGGAIGASGIALTAGTVNTTSSNHYNITDTGDMTIAGTLTANGSSISVGGNWDSSAGSFTRGNSTVAMTGATKNLTTKSGGAFYNLQISGDTTTQTNQFYVYNALTVDNAKTLTLAANLSMQDGAVTTINGTITGSGRLYLSDTAAANLSTTGTLSSYVFFQSSAKDITVPARTYGNLVYIENDDSGAAHTATLGTAAGQTLTLQSYLMIRTTTAYNFIVDASVYNPTINISTNLGFQSGGAGTPSLKLGSGAWAVGGNVTFSNGTVTPGTSTVTLNGSGAQSVTSSGQSFNALTITNASASGVTFADRLQAATFNDTTAGSVLKFSAASAGSPHTISTAMNITGGSSKITLAPSVAATTWYISAPVGTTVTSASVSYSNSTNHIIPVTCTDGGNNVNWGFNTVPVASGVLVNSGDTYVTLLGGTTKNVTCTASLQDDNNYSDITNVTAKFYRSGVGASASDDNSNHYTVTGAKESYCTGSGTTGSCTFIFAVYYYADPTDAGSAYDGQNWVCQVTPSNGLGAGTAATSTIGMYTLKYIDVTSSINYGSLTPGSSSTQQSVSVANHGNSAITYDVSGENLDCTGSGIGTISVDKQHYSTTNNFDYSSGSALSSSNTSVGPLSKPTQSSPASQNLYWKISVPAGTKGTCTGANSFTIN